MSQSPYYTSNPLLSSTSPSSSSSNNQYPYIPITPQSDWPYYPYNYQSPPTTTDNPGYNPSQIQQTQQLQHSQQLQQYSYHQGYPQPQQSYPAEAFYATLPNQSITTGYNDQLHLSRNSYSGAMDQMNMSGIDLAALRKTYNITPIQQPQRSASFEGTYLSRITLSPPLILQLDCWDANSNLEIPHNELPFLVVHLTLETTEGQDITMVADPNNGQATQMLYGTLVAAPAEMTDQAGASGVYFCFPDVSVRFQGRFRIKANLMRITGGQPLCTTYTDFFDIVDVNTYVAPALTDMTRHFDAQGVVKFGLPRREW